MKEAYYFSHDSNARQDERILALRMKLGWEGYGLYWAVVEKLREASSYSLKPDYNLIAFDLRCDTSKVKSVIEDFGLFVFADDGEYFYSKRLSKTMAVKSEKAKKAANARWTKKAKDIEVDTTAMQVQCKRNANAMHSNAYKVKKSKVKESINIYRAFAHLSMTLVEFEKLNQSWKKSDIDATLDAIENYKKNTQYKSLYLTAKNWLKKSHPLKTQSEQQLDDGDEIEISVKKQKEISEKAARFATQLEDSREEQTRKSFYNKHKLRKGAMGKLLIEFNNHLVLHPPDKPNYDYQEYKSHFDSWVTIQGGNRKLEEYKY